MDMGQCKYYLEQKLDLVERLLNITREIYENLDRSINIQEKMELRAKIIKDIENVDRVYKNKCNLKEAWSQGEFKQEIENLQKMFLEMQNLDQRLIEKMKLVTNELLDDYKKLKQVNKVRNAYNDPRMAKRHILDKQR